MQPKNTRITGDAGIAERNTWVSPRITRLAASEAEIGPAVNGIDLERVS